MKNLEKFWNSCDENFAHISLSRHLPGFDKISKYWERSFISKLELDQKSVLEYGIGGGFLGKYLFDTKKISKYYGVDISKRSLDHAKKNLLQYQDKAIFLSTNEFYSKFNQSVDVFISQACIQHFPNEKYLIKFLSKLNALNSETIVLQIRYSTKNEFSNSTNKEKLIEEDLVFACKTNNSFISKHLINYTNIYESSIDSNSNYQFLIYKIKK